GTPDPRKIRCHSDSYVTFLERLLTTGFDALMVSSQQTWAELYRIRHPLTLSTTHSEGMQPSVSPMPMGMHLGRGQSGTLGPRMAFRTRCSSNHCFLWESFILRDCWKSAGHREPRKQRSVTAWP